MEGIEEDPQEWENEEMALQNARVVEIERGYGQTHITLQFTQVTSERNFNEEAWLDEAQSRALIRDLQGALLRGARCPQGHGYKLDTDVDPPIMRRS